MSRTTSEAGPRSEAGPSLGLGRQHGPVPDPFATLPEALARLDECLAAEEWLDAFLWAAGALQIVEDRLDAVSWPPRRLLVHLARNGSDRPGLRLASRSLDAAVSGYSAAPPARALRAWADRVSGLTLTLAVLVTEGLVADGVAPEGLVTAGAPEAAVSLAARLLEGPGRGAARLVSGDLLRPPACFRSFDQHPADVIALARRFAEVYPERDAALLVLGIRTSGSYLAPLTGAALLRLGYWRVAVATTRPGVPPPRGARTAARVLLVDDPPVTGGALAAAAAALERHGLVPEAVVPVFACFDDAPSTPVRLARYSCVTLPGSDWHVRSLLSPGRLRTALPGLLEGARLVDLRVMEPGQVSRTRHLGVPLDIVVEHPGGAREELALHAQWAGLGRFGRLTGTSAAALDGLVPRVRGFSDGVLLRDRLPGETPRSRLDALPAPPSPVEVARYVAERERRLALGEDRSGRLGGRDPVWESAARTLAPVLGRATVVLRPTLVQPLTRRLLAAAARPCLVDGRTAPERWAVDGDGSPRKLDWAEGGFANLDLACYDAAYDLAGTVAHGPPDDPAEEELLGAYRELSGRSVDPARWFLFQLVQARNAVRLTAGTDAHEGPLLRARARRAQARAAQRFLAGALLADLGDRPTTLREDGWCVLDIDGVLETDVLGFSAPSPLGMLALRALRAHGYPTLLATGRSLAEVRDRCAAYRLAGGVAEYGAVCYDAVSGRSLVLVDEARRREGDGGLTALLDSRPGHETDPFSHWNVRASIRHADGRRTGLPEQETAELLAREPLARLFDVVCGDAQTDFVPRGVDKAQGVRASLALAGAPAEPPLLAVGDGPADLPLLRWARLAAVPAHARRVAGDGMGVTRGAFQAGLADAVGGLLGHRPGGCSVCRPPSVPTETRAVLAILALPEAGRRGALARLARLVLADASLVVRAGGRGRGRAG